MKKTKKLSIQNICSTLILIVFATLIFSFAPIPKLANHSLADHAHQYQITISKEPTCTEKGQKLFQCSCGHSYTEDLQPLGHNTNKIKQIEPSCDKEGQVIYQCARCHKETIEPIPAKVHHPGRWRETIKPGFFKTGKSVVQCDLCHKQLQAKTLHPACPFPPVVFFIISFGILFGILAICGIIISIKKKQKK